MAKSDASAKHVLTRNQQLVFDLLQERREPTTAYDILDALRDSGFRAPPQAYRALDRLQTLGLVHRVDSLNAFVACCHPDHSNPSEPVMLAVCTECHAVTELSSKGIRQKLIGLSAQCDLQPEGLSVELRGCCVACQAGRTSTKGQ